MRGLSSFSAHSEPIYLDLDLAREPHVVYAEYTIFFRSAVLILTYITYFKNKILERQNEGKTIAEMYKARHEHDEVKLNPLQLVVTFMRDWRLRVRDLLRTWGRRHKTVLCLGFDELD